MRQVNHHQQVLFQSEPKAIEVDETSLWQGLKPTIDSFPDQDTELLPGLKWGVCYQLYTPAFWKLQYVMNTFSDEQTAHQIGGNLIEEIIQCILGGYGIPSEMGTMAFERLRQRGLIQKQITFDSILVAMKEPFINNQNKLVNYRFAHQKSVYIHDFLNREDLDEIPDNDDLRLREWLMGLKGIGPKTASWITRNWLRSERVAILDIHILRAGMITGFFDKHLNVTTQYYHLEANYLNFCNLLEVRPSDMDAIIWSYMKNNNKLALSILSTLT
ncbi:8-oxoguanine DNA glycosylase [Pedobacter nanyangensis]|uniref:8-oxoguanine DNA glycosylase n=1 Tax=Pedobacter nanyangensis TaxID=1562389 RepID=UPI000DE27FCC|nr:8-oxoguanine DNA glycosylase [Pedobacter nanyangensis]